MKKFFLTLLIALFYITPVLALDIPTISATAYGPNHVILTWNAVANPGWGYRVEYKRSIDPTYTEVSWRNGLSVVPPWVTDPGGSQKVYTDPTTASSGWGQDAQCNIYGLEHSTTYNFRVRTWGQKDNKENVFSGYSNVVNATTSIPNNIYYVSLSGANNRTGESWAQAWRNMWHASTQVGAGDLVLVAGGNYASDTITSSVNGSPGLGRITFQANYGETVTITSRNSDYIMLLNRNYWVIDGINSTAPAVGSTEPVNITGNRNAIVNAEIDATASTGQAVWGFVQVSSGTYNLLHNLYIHNCCGSTNYQQMNSTILDFENSVTNFNTIQYSHLSRGSHDTGYSQGDYNRFLNNLVDGGLGIGFEIQFTADYNLIEGNYIKDQGKNFDVQVYKPGVEISASNHTIRRNIIADTAAIWAVGANANGLEISDVGASSDNSFYHNNTLVRIGGTGIVLWGATGNELKNNLVYDAGLGVIEYGARSLHEDPPANTNVAEYNLFLDVSGGGAELPGATTLSFNYSAAVTVAAADANNTGDEAFFNNNIGRPTDAYSPVFIDYNNRNWENLHVQSTSGMIDAGTVVSNSVWGPMACNGPCDVGAFEYYEIAENGDITPPVMSNPQPTGVQPCSNDPESITIQLITDEDSNCKYDTSNVSYAAMTNTYNTTGGLSHSQNLTLACDSSYTYYSQCSDGSGNETTDALVTNFSIDKLPEQPGPNITGVQIIN